MIGKPVPSCLLEDVTPAGSPDTGSNWDEEGGGAAPEGGLKSAAFCHLRDKTIGQ